MDKNIIFCIVAIDEAVAIADIEPFHCASDFSSYNYSSRLCRSFFLKFFCFYLLSFYFFVISGI